jgi:hypothetical protein
MCRQTLLKKSQAQLCRAAGLQSGDHEKFSLLGYPGRYNSSVKVYLNYLLGYPGR